MDLENQEEGHGGGGGGELNSFVCVRYKLILILCVLNI